MDNSRPGFVPQPTIGIPCVITYFLLQRWCEIRNKYGWFPLLPSTSCLFRLYLGIYAPSMYVCSTNQSINAGHWRLAWPWSCNRLGFFREKRKKNTFLAFFSVWQWNCHRKLLRKCTQPHESSDTMKCEGNENLCAHIFVKVYGIFDPDQDDPSSLCYLKYHDFKLAGVIMLTLKLEWEFC